MADKPEDLTQVRAAAGLPDVPNLELDQLLAQLISRAQEVLTTQGRLRSLLRANQAIGGNLPLPVLLQRIVLAACELAHARYGALGVIDPTGEGLEQFVHVGIDSAEASRIGPLPQGLGLLGALIRDPKPIRLESMSDDERSTGFPPNHPPMRGFLGVPVRVRNEVFGNLYLTERESGVFTQEDEELVSALAATAGVAIENARLHEEAHRRQDWLEASAEVNQQLLAAEGEEPLLLIVRRARQLADAELALLLLPTADGQRLIVEVASGELADEVTAFTYPIENTLVEQVLQTNEAVLIADAGAVAPQVIHLAQVVPIGPLMVLPLGRAQPARGALVIVRFKGRHRFAKADLEMAATFANHAAVAMELSDARADQQRLVLLEDRDRIARDLHDHVIQRLFAIGLTVQSVASVLTQNSQLDRLNRVVTDIDETIRQTRTSIFQLRGALSPEVTSVRAQLLAVVAEVAPLLGFSPEVRFAGPVDTLVPEQTANELVAVVREALTNVGRHAKATRVELDVTVTAAQLSIAVADDGIGIGEVSRRSGLANLARRAELNNGSFSTGPGLPAAAPSTNKGTHLLWTISLG
jgi:signal transduction histidine kinase